MSNYPWGIHVIRFPHSLVAVALALTIGSVLAAEVEATRDPDTPTTTGRVESAVGGAVDTARDGIHTGVTAAIRGAQRGVQAAGQGIETGARAVGRAMQRMGQKLQDAAG